MAANAFQQCIVSSRNDITVVTKRQLQFSALYFFWQNIQSKNSGFCVPTWNFPVASSLPQPATQQRVPVPLLNLNRQRGMFINRRGPGQAETGEAEAATTPTEAVVVANYGGCTAPARGGSRINYDTSYNQQQKPTF